MDEFIFDINLSLSMSEKDLSLNIYLELSRLLPYMSQTWQITSDIAAIYIPLFCDCFHGT